MEFQQSQTLVTTEYCYCTFEGTWMHIFSTRHSTHGAPEVAVAVVRAVIAGIEVQGPRVVRTALDERSRPVVAVGACVAEATIAATAGSGEKD